MAQLELDALLDRVTGLDEETKASARATANDIVGDMKWLPNPGRQTEAYVSKADVLLYGGRAGGGKTHLELGLAVNEFENAIIFRRKLSQTDGLEREGKIIIGNDARFNGQELEWTWPNGKTIKLGGMKDPDSWMDHAGRERDFIAFDEAGEFLEKQVASILAWLRAAPGVRTRMVLGSNPPRTTEGLWMTEWFAPWLDRKFPNPAKSGELRWAIYVTDENDESQMVWVDGPGEHEIDDEIYIAKSYTFIPASLEDNPFRNTPEYVAQLQSLPEPLRSQLLYGDFGAGMKDNANQCIPTEWVRLAMARREPSPPIGVPMCAIGVDCSGGGSDPMVQAARFDGWYAPFMKTPAKDIPAEKAGAYAAGMVVANRRDEALVVVDLGGGYGGPLYEHLKDNEIECQGFKGAEKSTRRSADSKLGFTNTRSAAYWLFREALDPGQPGGSPIQLPDDPRLLAGLTAPIFEVTPNGIKVEPKVTHGRDGKVTGGVVAKLGFSPDEADAVVMAWHYGAKEVNSALKWAEQTQFKRTRHPKVVLGGHTPLSARRRR